MSETKTPEAVRPRDFRTPVGRARGLGSGKTGTDHFWWLRVTSVALIPLFAWFVGTLVSLAGADLATVQTVLARPFNAVAFALFVVSTFWHAKLGLQVVIEDYIHQRGLEIGLQILVTFACAAGALASLYAIARIALLG
ncbi:MAG: succinate dehydrogenase, hydrophobic membrane anchor protein [Luteimonas sp.]